MADDLKLHKDAARGAQAQALLDNELLKEAFTALQQEYIKYWLNCPSLDDVAGRERLWQAAVLLDKVQAHLTKVVWDGKLAEAEIRGLAEGSRGK